MFFCAIPRYIYARTAPDSRANASCRNSNIIRPARTKRTRSSKSMSRSKTKTHHTHIQRISPSRQSKSPPPPPQPSTRTPHPPLTTQHSPKMMDPPISSKFSLCLERLGFCTYYGLFFRRTLQPSKRWADLGLGETTPGKHAQVRIFMFLWSGTNDHRITWYLCPVCVNRNPL